MMRKLVCALLVMLLCVSAVGCGSAPAGDNTNAGNEPTENNVTDTVTTAPQEVELTVENIDEYLLYSIEVVTFEEDYISGLDLATGFADVKIKTMSKQNVEFKNVSVKFKIVASNEKWSELFVINADDTRTIEIPYNGVREDAFRIKSASVPDYISRPNLSLQVESVSGTVVEN